MSSKAQRRNQVNWALIMAENTTIAPTEYERNLLKHYVEGRLTIDEVIELLEYDTTRRPTPV